MSSLYEVIQRIKKRPSMYLGKRSISNLRAFLSGYILSRRELGMAQTDQEKEFGEFPAWLQKKFGINSTQAWDSIILFYCEDERDALEKFFNLFEEYLNRNNNTENEIDDDVSVETATISL